MVLGDDELLLDDRLWRDKPAESLVGGLEGRFALACDRCKDLLWWSLCEAERLNVGHLLDELLSGGFVGKRSGRGDLGLQLLEDLDDVVAQLGREVFEGCDMLQHGTT